MPFDADLRPDAAERAYQRARELAQRFPTGPSLLEQRERGYREYLRQLGAHFAK